MSLLLDALKKAAEQKAAKSREAEPGKSTSDKTILLDETRTEPATKIEQTAVHADDRTQLDHTQIEQSSLDETEVRGTDLEIRLDDTGIEASQIESTQSGIDHTQFQSTRRGIDPIQFDSTQSEIESRQFEPTKDETTHIRVDQTVYENPGAEDFIDFIEDPTKQHEDGDDNIILTDDDVIEFLGDYDNLRPGSKTIVQEVADKTLADSTQVDSTKVDSTQVDSTQVGLTQVDSTKVDSTKVDSTKVDSTKVDSTKVDSTKVDSTQVDSTKVDSTRVGLTQVDLTQVDSTRVDSTQVDSTQVDSTRVDATRVDATQVDSTQVGLTQVDSTQVDATRVDSTQVDSTRVDSTQVDSTQVDSTQVDSTRVDSTQVDSTRVDSTQVDSTQVDSTRVDSTQVDSTQVDSIQVDLTQIDSTQADTTTSDTTTSDTTRSDTTRSDTTRSDTTRSDTTRSDTTTSDATTSDATTSDATAAMTAIEDIHTETDILSDDDDLSLLLVDVDDTRVAADSEIRTENIDDETKLELLAEDGTSTHSLNLVSLPEKEDLGDDTDSLSSNPDLTGSTSISLETLTNQGALARPDTTSTRTYAPDNYDRTLMKVADGDASKIFAGMKSEEDVVMTPDYAKKVFISKSSAQKAQHYKVYTGIAVVILLVIGISGLYELQLESENIDTSLRPLKLDPMPGIIQIKQDSKSANLFGDTVDSNVDLKTLELVENAENQAPVEPDETSTEGESNGDLSQLGGTPETRQPDTVVAGSAISVSAATDKPKSKAIARDAGEAQGVDKTQPYEISSTRRVTDKDNLLREAYAAYQKGDDKNALSKYKQVLVLDPDNRNALLAGAAIKIQQGKNSEAIVDYQKILLANPKDSLAMSSLIAVANYSPKQAESQLKLMIREEPDSPYLNFALANILGAQNRWQEAQSRYFKALENNPSDPNYAYNLAVSLEHISKPKVAISYYEKALSNFENGLATFNRDVVDQRLEILRQL